MEKIKKIAGITVFIIALYLTIFCTSTVNATTDETKIHFLNVVRSADIYSAPTNTAQQLDVDAQGSDCMLIENNGKYGLIDTGLKASEDFIVEYLTNQNIIELEFIILTHTHSDHTGSTLKILDTFSVKTLYLKEAASEYLTGGIGSNYYYTLLKAYQKGVTIIGPSTFGQTSTITGSASLPDNVLTEFDNTNTKFSLGTSQIELFNWEIAYDENGNRYVVENDNHVSMGVLLQQGNKRAFLAGDINNNVGTGGYGPKIGTEDRIGPLIGDVDLLKMGHHGNTFSSTPQFLNILQPEYAIITYSHTEGIEGIQRKWLEEYETEYYFVSDDPEAVIATMTNNSISVDFANPTGWKTVSGEWKYFDNGTIINPYHSTSENKTVSSWTELYDAITSTVNYAKIELRNSENWQVDQLITIPIGKKIELVTSDTITMIRKNTYKGSFFQNNGTLTIGNSTMTGKIILDGNKANVTAERSLLYNTGTLNLYNTILRNNKTNVNQLITVSTNSSSTSTTNYENSGSAVYTVGIPSVFNMYGGEITGNETDNTSKITFNHVTTYSRNICFFSSGSALVLVGGKATIDGGKIQNNVTDNHAEIVANESNISGTISSYARGIFVRKALINIENTIISNNEVNNCAKVNLTNSTMASAPLTAQGGGIYFYVTYANIKNTHINNNQVTENAITNLENATIGQTSASRGGRYL